MQGPRKPEISTVDLRGRLPFPEPAAVISLRATEVYRAVDDDNQPILILTDGVTTLALESGMSGLTPGVVSAAERLADAVKDFSQSVRATWARQQEEKAP